MSDAKRGGRASAGLTQLVLATYGNVCHLKLPGCTRRATTKDHLIPYSHGGSDALSNLRPACKPCNSKRGNMILSGYGARIVVVIGPPAAGKSTHVLEHAAPQDVMIDLDKLARAFMPHPPESTHTYPEHIRDVAIAARKGAIDRAVRRGYGCTVWIIHANPAPNIMAMYKALRYQIVTIDPGRTIVEQRAHAERPAIMRAQVARWYASPWATSTSEHELGMSAHDLGALPTVAPVGEWKPEW